ncbi:hypothetical protein ERC79_17530 [Rhodococcus sp. ABRD24]|uniref:hypothetical protein n=1 Tax=Rhodococcus sp. ABRD24 TaxID=2507582 RepID=UPI001039CE78|nr:hypothetical protein [Rhodococcus sp. ABRD24]QBJ97542.1 hypothetical protein ERC79_17530 [Rhodococcus sp. ABRD24]
MKLRLGALSAPTQKLPGDLTGHAITIDLSHIGVGQDAAAAALISELLARGAARLVISGTDDAKARALVESAKHNAPPSGIAA